MTSRAADPFGATVVSMSLTVMLCLAPCSMLCDKLKLNVDAGIRPPYAYRFRDRKDGLYRPTRCRVFTRGCPRPALLWPYSERHTPAVVGLARLRHLTARVGLGGGEVVLRP